MLQNACKTLGFKKNMVYEIPPGDINHIQPVAYTEWWVGLQCVIMVFPDHTHLLSTYFLHTHPYF